MNAKSPPARLIRLIEFLRAIQSRPSVSVKELAERFDAAPNTIFRYVDELNGAGVPVDVTSNGLCVPSAFVERGQPFSSHEAAILSLGLSLLEEKSAVDAETAAALRHKLMPQRDANLVDISERVRTETAMQTPADTGVMRTLREAVLDRIRLRIVYASLERGETTEREISPYTLVHRRESWYAIAWCHERESVRTFKVSRVQSAARSHEPFFTDPEYDPDDYLLYSWNILSGEPNVVLARFDKTAGPLILEKRLAHGRVWKEQGFVYLRAIVSGLDEFSWWIMQYGEHAEVLQPRELRRKIGKRCAKMAETYADTLYQRSRRLNHD
ncbi:MAG: WYL domain-containing protein [bacterium]|nr:WYL domain-containing protein [bacterium]